MSAVDVEEQIEAIAHLDFEPVCDVFDIVRTTIFHLVVVDTYVPCGAPATFGVICRICALRSFCCDRHAHSGSEPTLCGACKTTGPFDEVMIAVPLSGVRS